MSADGDLRTTAAATRDVAPLRAVAANAVSPSGNGPAALAVPRVRMAAVQPVLRPGTSLVAALRTTDDVAGFAVGGR